MPISRSIEDLRSNYNEISEYCHSHNEPVYITIGGKIDLVVMSIEHYEQMTKRYNSAAEAMRILAEKMQGKSENAGLSSESDIMKLVKEIRAEIENE